MTLTVYHLKTCDTCRKAIKALTAAGHQINLIDVRADGMPKDALEKIADRAGWEMLLNTRSTTWRNLPDSDKANVDRGKATGLMSDHPTLIKRPVIIREEDVYVGWKADVQKALL